MKIDLISTLSILSVPFTNGLTWYFSRRQRNNNTIQSLQLTIDTFEKKNRELYNEVINLRDLNSKLEAKQNVFEREMTLLKKSIENQKQM